ncbi:MAG: Rieske 2Fe-2S domain-containing protein [Verrucomicrobiota bacterium]|nr:Rieske 2Fe-2S domain-containing protein [Verrucomicrobiota bacterium]
MSHFVIAAAVDAVKVGAGTTVTVDGNDIGLFNLNGEFFAIENTCPHMGAPLAGGCVREEMIICPWHMWKFNIKTGVSVTVPGVDLKTFETKVEDGHILVKL